MAILKGTPCRKQNKVSICYWYSKVMIQYITVQYRTGQTCVATREDGFFFFFAFLQGEKDKNSASLMHYFCNFSSLLWQQ